MSQVRQSQGAKEEESGVLSELQSLREQLEKSDGEKKALETQLSEANSSVTQLQQQGSCLVMAAAKRRVMGQTLGPMSDTSNCMFSLTERFIYFSILTFWRPEKKTNTQKYVSFHNMSRLILRGK